MPEFIENFRFCQEANRDPFDENDDIKAENYQFLYLTGRGQCSRLFPETKGDIMVAEAERCIPMGYTQIWVIQWARSINPGATKIKSSQRRAAQNLRKDRIQEQRSWVLLGEDGVYLGWSDKLHSAVEAAGVISAEKRIRIAIGLLKADITWH